MENFKVFINFKTYSRGTGKKAVELAKICEGFGGIGRVEVIPVVQAVDLCRVKEAVKIPIWLQHLDPQPQGAFTGWQNLEAVVSAGANGVLLNHSEHQIPPGTTKQILGRIREIRVIREKERFEAMVCCKTLGQMERLVKFKPDYVGYEISGLIGGEVSITDFDPKSVGHAKEICKGIPLIVGAGIHKAEDLEKARNLGAAGVLISSAVVLAEDPKEKLQKLLTLL